MAKSKRQGPQKVIIGAAGEHYVLSQLFIRGISAGRPPEGPAEIDLIIFDTQTHVRMGIQVKTRIGRGRVRWPMNARHEGISNRNLVYVFVDFGSAQPVCYIVPSCVVARYVKVSHATWLHRSGARGQKHNDNPMREVRNESRHPIPGFPNGWMEQYREDWSPILSPSKRNRGRYRS